MKKKKNVESTFDKVMKNPERKRNFEKGYNKFLLSEFLLEAMNENHVSVRKLSDLSGVSTSIIQNIRSEKTSNVTFSTLNNLLVALGYRIQFEKIQEAS